MRVKTKADVMKRAHEITAPTFAEALAAAWAETREIEKEYAAAVEKTIREIRAIKSREFDTMRDLVEMVDFIISDNNFSSFPVKLHANLYMWQISPLETIKVNTWTGEKYNVHAVIMGNVK